MRKLVTVLSTAIMMLGVAVEASAAKAEPVLRYKEDFLRQLVAAVPRILKNQDPKTGRFGTGIWIVNDQHDMFPLAVAWATKSDDNPYYHDPKVLEAIMAAGDALIADADENGQWEFRKKDGSTWGKVYMCWTYSRWIRSFGLIRDAMPPDRREKWEKALILAYTNIAKTQLHRVHNIPSQHAASLYIAGQLFDRPEWCEQAKEFIAKVVAEQDPGGFWSENHGPVVSYNFVYSDALGYYYWYSKDESVLPALQRASRFHANFSYPDGSKVETIDERNPYHAGIALGNQGFTYSPEGRGFLAEQFDLLKKAGKPISADSLAHFILHGEEGPYVPTASAERDRKYILPDGKALVRRKSPWFICLSAYHCPIPTNRWIQDRQNLVSIFHDKCGLIVGGGNTKLQPLWSTFTVGDVSLLKHTPGDTNPVFVPAGPLIHVPTGAGIGKSDPPSLGLTYGEERCSVRVEPVDDRTCRISLKATSRSGQPVAAHLTLIPHLGQMIRTGAGAERPLDPEGFDLTGDKAGGWIAHAGWKLSLPPAAKVTWPVLPHNPYRKDGAAEPPEGRIVVTLPFSQDVSEYELTITVE